MSSTQPESLASGHSSDFRALGIIALCLAIATAVCALGLLGLAATLYAPIAKATTVSACEGPSLTFAQEQVSSLVVNLKSIAILGSLILGLATFPVSLVAVFLNGGRRWGLVAIFILVVATAIAVLLLDYAFPIDPRMWHITCGGG